MSFTEKIDVLDLLIQILEDHEEKLDQIAERLEAIADKLTEPVNYPRLKEIVEAIHRSTEKLKVDDTDQMKRFYENL